MQVSTNLPYGSNAIKTHLESGVPLELNVSKEADAAFLSELRRTDPARYSRLRKTLDTASYAAQREAQTPRCWHCMAALPDNLRADSKYCDATCKKASQRKAA